MTTVHITREISISVDAAAEWFANISDDDMAQFFCAVAKYAKEWPQPSFPPDHMWWLVGRHIAECKCSTDEGREMIREIAAAMDYQKEKV